jgi:homoserine/homoserine lactone efflux protein
VLTTLSYTGFTLLGMMMGKAALKAVFNIWIRRGLALCFIIYGVLLGASSMPQAEVMR